MSQVVHLQFSKFWAPNRRSGKPLIFVFDELLSMGKCIMLVYYHLQIFSGVLKSWKTEILQHLCIQCSSAFRCLGQDRQLAFRYTKNNAITFCKS